MANIAINGKKLHDINMNLKEEGYSRSSLSYPEHRIKCGIENDKITIKLPLQLTLALYYQRIISQDNSKVLQIKIKDRNKGLFIIEDLIYPDGLYT